MKFATKEASDMFRKARNVAKESGLLRDFYKAFTELVLWEKTQTWGASGGGSIVKVGPFPDSFIVISPAGIPVGDILYDRGRWVLRIHRMTPGVLD